MEDGKRKTGWCLCNPRFLFPYSVLSSRLLILETTLGALYGLNGKGYRHAVRIQSCGE